MSASICDRGDPEYWTDKFERIFKSSSMASEHENALPQDTYPPSLLWRSLFFHTVKRELAAGDNHGRRYLRIDYPGLDALAVYEYPSAYDLTLELAFGSPGDTQTHGMSVDQLLSVLQAKVFHVPSYACTSFAMGHIMHALVHSPAFVARSLRDAPADVPPPFTLTLDSQYPYMASFRPDNSPSSILPLSPSLHASVPEPPLASGLFKAPAALETYFREADSRIDILRLNALALLTRTENSKTRHCSAAVQTDWETELPSFSFISEDSSSEASVLNMLGLQECGPLGVGLGVEPCAGTLLTDSVMSEVTVSIASADDDAHRDHKATDSKEDLDVSGQFDDAEPSNETQDNSFSTLDSFGPATPFTQRILLAPSTSVHSTVSLSSLAHAQSATWPKSPCTDAISTFSLRRSLNFTALYRSKAWLARKKPDSGALGKDAFRASGFSASFTR